MISTGQYLSQEFGKSRKMGDMNNSRYSVRLLRGGWASVLEGGKAGLCTLSLKRCRCLQIFGPVAAPLPSGARS